MNLCPCGIYFRRLTYGLLLSIFLVLSHTPIVSAHTFKSDGSISAILHIEPGDKPISGVVTSYLFFIHDSTGEFSIPSCYCSVTVKEHGKTVSTQAPKMGTQGVLNDAATFPNPDVYDLIFKGDPIKPGSFQPFSFDYLVRVTEGQPTRSPLSMALLGVFTLLIIVTIFACWFQLKHNILEEKES